MIRRLSPRVDATLARAVVLDFTQRYPAYRGALSYVCVEPLVYEFTYDDSQDEEGEYTSTCLRIEAWVRGWNAAMELRDSEEET